MVTVGIVDVRTDYVQHSVGMLQGLNSHQASWQVPDVTHTFTQQTYRNAAKGTEHKLFGFSIADSLRLLLDRGSCHDTQWRRLFFLLL